jgi:hypothetical protein
MGLFLLYSLEIVVLILVQSLRISKCSYFLLYCPGTDSVLVPCVLSFPLKALLLIK